MVPAMATMVEQTRAVDTTPAHEAPAERLTSVDLLRGVVMVVMALDHTRDFLGDLVTNPTDLSRASTALFLTRWITHFCAPTFFLLAGTGARLSLARRGRDGVSRFLLTRGLWLVVLELTVLRWAWQFNLDYRVTVLNVIWALGWSMVALSLLVRLPDRAVAIIAVLMIALHNGLDGLAPERFGALAPLWNVLHRPGLLPSPAGTTIFLAYPLVPWIGVMAAGWALGAVYEWSPDRRRRWLLTAGACLVWGFVLLYPMCRWFAAFKARRRDRWWVGYL